MPCTCRYRQIKERVFCEYEAYAILCLARFRWLGHIKTIVSTMLFFLFYLGSASISQAIPNIQAGCNEVASSIFANDSINQYRFQKLLKKGATVTLEEFLILWYPDRDKPFPAFDFKSCKVFASSADTYYSWGPYKKILTMKSAMPDGANWNGEPNPSRLLDTIRSAVGSFGYGLYPVRIKLKENRPSSCNEEFPILDSNVIESWSYGTPEHYDEIVRDYRRYLLDNNWIGYGFNPGPLFFKCGMDSHEFSPGILKKSLLKMISMILKGEGRIYYNADACRNRKRAFETDYPSYMNPFLH